MTTDVAPIGRGSMYALTSGGEEQAPTNGKLLRVSLGRNHALADLFAFEARVNPDGGVIESNPFDVAKLSGIPLS